MPIYTYTTQLPSQNPVENAREFVKLPRSILLAPYLANNSYYKDYTDAIDNIFDAPIESKIDGLKNIRNMWVPSKMTEALIAQNHIVDFNTWGGPDRATIIEQVNLLGMKLTNAGMVNELSYRALAKFLGTYWFQKGTDKLVDFLSFTLSNTLQLFNLWTNDYKTFLQEGDSGIGTTIYAGGTWYPTSHVRLVTHDYTIDVLSIAHFFYEVCNYNIVLESIMEILDFDIATSSTSPIAHSFGLGVVTAVRCSFSTDSGVSGYTGHSYVGGGVGLPLFY